mgnify:CR=1 FL=1
MTDMQPTITPKSDQMNSDDLIAGPRTITIRDVKIAPGTEQPCAVFFNGDDGKPYLPCKSMRRVMVALWGPDAAVYSGRSMTLYRDPSVTWGGMEVGGIRISHMSHIDKTTVVVLTATKKARKPFTVAPLVMPKPQESLAETPRQRARAFADELLSGIAACQNEDAIHDVVGNAKTQRIRDRLRDVLPEADEEVAQALTKRFNDFVIPARADADDIYTQETVA